MEEVRRKKIMNGEISLLGVMKVSRVRCSRLRPNRHYSSIGLRSVRKLYRYYCTAGIKIRSPVLSCLVGKIRPLLSRQAEVRMLTTSRASDGYHTMSGVSADPLVEPKQSIGDRVSMHAYFKAISRLSWPLEPTCLNVFTSSGTKMADLK